MERRTKIAYSAVWQFVKKNFPNFKPATAMTDYEDALRSSLEEEFPGTVLLGCHFHYSQVRIQLNIIDNFVGSRKRKIILGLKQTLKQ